MVELSTGRRMEWLRLHVEECHHVESLTRATWGGSEVPWRSMQTHLKVVVPFQC